MLDARAWIAQHGEVAAQLVERRRRARDSVLRDIDLDACDGDVERRCVARDPAGERALGELERFRVAAESVASCGAADPEPLVARVVDLLLVEQREGTRRDLVREL